MKYYQNAVLGIALASCMVLSIGCAKSGGKDASAAQKLGGSFSTEMTMTMDDFTATGTLTRMGEGTWNVSFTEPASLAGVMLDFTGGEVNASYKGLAFSVPQTAMPAKSVLYQLIQVVDTLAQQKEITGEADGEYVEVAGELEGTPYILKLTKSGDLAAFEVDNMDANLQFAKFQSNGVAVATETTALEQTEAASME